MKTRFAVAVVALSAVLAGACQYADNTSTSSSSSTSTPTSPTTTTPTTPADPTTPTTPTTPANGLTYTNDIKPIMTSDCVRCHGPAIRDAGYDLSTYAGVMRAVSAGSANSLLIRVTQSGGLMYGELSGNRTQKAQTIHDWVVTWKAPQ